MLTDRSRWLILLGVCGAVLGLLRGQETLALTSIAVLAWVFIEWVIFRGRVELQFRHLRCERMVNNSTATSGTLWVERTMRVKVRVVADQPLRFPFARIEEFLPENIETLDGNPTLDTAITSAKPVELDYAARPRGAGTIVLPGVCLKLFDLQGLFAVQRFLPCRQEFRVLPTGIDVEANRPTTKFVNAMPPPGIHRFLRPGIGSELLELREYAPGDPPKSIAWKVSARRDTLMTRQYESEVPVRTLLFIDGSFSSQLGSYGSRPLDQIILHAASITRAAMSVRDPIGFVLFDDATNRVVRPGGGERHFFRMINELTDCATPTAPPPSRLTVGLFDHAWRVCSDLYPELLERRVNRLPFTFFPIRPGRRRQRKRREQLANVFSALYGLDDDAPIRLVYDDLELAAHCQRLLTDAGFAWTGSVIDRRTRNLEEWHGKVESLTNAITTAVAHASDNELYVLLVDLIDYTGPLGRLAKAIGVARARHHRVVVICPWPDEQPYRPDDEPTLTPDTVPGLLRRAERLRIESSATRLKRELRRLGVPVAFCSDRKSVQLVMNQAELARSGRTAAVRRG